MRYEFFGRLRPAILETMVLMMQGSCSYEIIHTYKLSSKEQHMFMQEERQGVRHMHIIISIAQSELTQ